VFPPSGKYIFDSDKSGFLIGLIFENEVTV
jgi:hypothetical protein